MASLFGQINRLFSECGDVAASASRAIAASPAGRGRARQAQEFTAAARPVVDALAVAQARSPRNSAEPGVARVGGGAKKAVLTALAQHGPRTRREIGLLTCLVSTAGSFGNVLSELRSAGWAVDLGDGRLEITEAGRDALGRAYTPLPTPGDSLLEAWSAKFGGGTLRLFWGIVRAGPEGITRADLGAEVGMQHTAGSFGNNLSTMRGQGVMIDIGKGPGRRFAIDPLVLGDGA